MIVQKEFLSKLKDFGLNSYESRLWTALLSRGISTAGELSDIAAVPRSRSYDVLESLERKGFIIMKLGKPIKYIAVPPTEVLERVRKRIQADTDLQLTQINTLQVSETLNELNSLHTQGVEMIEPTELSGSLKGRNNIYSHLEHRIKQANTSIRIMTTKDGLSRKLESLLPSLSKAVGRGVKVKIAAPIPSDSKTHTFDLPKGVELLPVKAVNARFTVIDGKELTFMLIDDVVVHPSYDVAVWVNTAFFALAVEKMFDNIVQKK